MTLNDSPLFAHVVIWPTDQGMMLLVDPTSTPSTSLSDPSALFNMKESQNSASTSATHLHLLLLLFETRLLDPYRVQSLSYQPQHIQEWA